MDDAYFDQYDYYNFGSGFDKIHKPGGSHAKTKERKINNFKYAPSGNVRLVVTKLQNSEKKIKRGRLRLNSV